MSAPRVPGVPDASGSSDAVDAAEPAPARPVLRIVSGNPSPEEIAALVAVIAAAGGGQDGGAPAGTRSTWADPHWRLTGAYSGRGGWRRSALPH